MLDPNAKELLRQRVLYILLVDFIITDQILIISAIWLREWRLVVIAFVPLSALTLTSIATLFGQKKITESLCDIVKELLKIGERKPK